MKAVFEPGEYGGWIWWIEEDGVRLSHSGQPCKTMGEIVDSARGSAWSLWGARFAARFAARRIRRYRKHQAKPPKALEL